MALVGESDSSLASQCMALCQALNSQGKAFKFSLTIGNTFSFSLDTSKGRVSAPKEKRASPSTIKRNARRREEFLSKKTKPAPVSEADLEPNQQALVEKAEFQCDQCDAVFKTRNGLKIHVGKSHKDALKSPEKMRDTSSQPLLTVYPASENSRTEPCPNCDRDTSPNHLCHEEPVSTVPETSKCEWCQQTFNCEDELDYHKSAGCAKPFVCQVCDVDCLDYSGRWKHEIQFH